MKRPLFLQRKADGDLVFPFAGKTWRCRDVDGVSTFSTEDDIGEMPHMSWLKASALMFLEKREHDNMQIQRAREKVVGLIILVIAVLTPILVAYIL